MMPEWSILIEMKKPWAVRAKVVAVADDINGGRGRAMWLAQFGMGDELRTGERVMGFAPGAELDLSPILRMIADASLEHDDYAEECLHRVRSVAGRTSNWTLCGKERKTNWGSVADSEYADPCLKCQRLASAILATGSL